MNPTEALPDRDWLTIQRWNDTAADYPRDQCIHQLFEAQAARTPDATAAIDEDRVLTYHELNVWANQVAHHLRQLGVGTEAPVGVCLDRSFELLAALLGVLKAGAAYVPLDPSYPAARLSFMLDDCQATVLLTRSALHSALPSTSAMIVDLDQSEAIARQSGENPSVVIDAESLAYVIYTSGSTGQPKGVLGRHRGAVNRLAWMWQAYPFEPNEVCCQKTALSFVDSVWETFGPLLAGIPSVLIPDEIVRDPNLFVETLAKRAVTRLVVVPSYLRVLLDRDGDLAARLPRLRYVVTSGEAISVELVQRFLVRLLGCRLLNLYGSSEVAADATYYEVHPGDFAASVPIGRPIANTEVYVLNAQGTLAPLGDVGELYVGGDCLAKGYLNRPELTSEKFIANPFRLDPEARLFRTGDLARYRPDGNLEFVGRADQQVKIRGFRIELGEVEATLRQNPAVRDAVVVVRLDRPNDPRLAAYVVVEPGSEWSDRDLRRFASERLPGFMVPGTFTLLNELPLLPNGKTDRIGLPSPSGTSLSASAYRAPASETELAIAQIWSDVLAVENVGVEDRFFDLGGDSLSATRVVTRIAQSIGVDVPLAVFIECPTIAALAGYVDAHPPADADTRAIPRFPRSDPIQVSISQETVWFLDQLRPGFAYYILPIALRLTGKVNPTALAEALDEIVRRHDVLRSRILRTGGRPALVVDAAQPVPLTRLDPGEIHAGDWEDAAVQACLNREATRPFDLSRDWPIRSALLTLGDEEHVLLITVHHVAFDGWSAGVLLEELFVLYRAFTHGEPSRLSEPPVRYDEFAAWQRERLSGDFLERLDAYWWDQLHGVRSEWWLPTDRPRETFRRPDLLSYRSDRVPFDLAPSLVDGIRGMSRQEGVTTFMTLFAMFGALLGSWSGHDDLVIGTPVAGRTHADLERLIGFFSNTLPLRLDLAGDPTFRELLGRVRELTGGAYTHQDLPAYRLVQTLLPTRDPASSPWLTVIFNQENGLLPPLDLPDLRVSPVDVATGVTLLELDLELFDSSERLHGYVEYATELFDRATVENLVRGYQSIGEAVVSDPDLRLSEVALISGAIAHPRPAQAMNAPDPATVTDHPSPPDDLEHVLVAIWRDVLGTESVGLDDNFFDLGGHSLLAIEVLALIEETIGRKLPVAAFFWAPTIASFAEVLRGGDWQPRWSSLLPVQAQGSRVPFFCVHGFGGGVLDYADLAGELGPDQPFYGLQALGRGLDQQPHDDIETMAAYYLEELRSVQPEGPYYLGGYCAGATIAFEMAQQLTASGRIVALLAVIEGEAPKSRYRSFRWGMRSLAGFCANLPYWVVDFAHLTPRQMRVRLERELRLRLRGGLGRFDSSSSSKRIIAAELTDTLEDLPDDVVNVIVSHQQAFIDYWPRPYPGRVTLLRVPRHPLICSYDTAKGWGVLARGGVDVRLIAGAHHTILAQPDVRSLGATLRACLDETQIDISTPAH
jgi:amino acid adenylation domain-containing protein